LFEVILQLYHGENKLHFYEMMTGALYKINTLHLIFVVLSHWNNSLRLDMLLHLGTLSSCGFKWGLCGSVLSFLCSILWIVVWPFVLFSFCHCFVCPSAIYGFYLPLWYPQTLLYTMCLVEKQHFIIFGLRWRGLEITSTLTITR